MNFRGFKQVASISEAMHTKPRPVGQVWTERADDAVRALWTPRAGCTAQGSPPPTRDSLGTPDRREDLAAFARAVQETAFAARPLVRSNCKVQPTTSMLSMVGLTANDASLKHARRRIRLASDFDRMLQQGFPNLSPAGAEMTLYITLTPKVASYEV